jgi:hypothetical protein
MKLDHLKLIGKFEFSKPCALWTIKLSLNFFRINWSRIRPHFQKRKCSSQPVLQVWKPGKKFLISECICFNGPNRALWTHFQTCRFLRDRLTFSYIWNTISSQILGVRLYMSHSSKWNVCRSLGRNPCPGLSPDAFVAVISIYLFHKFSGLSRKLLNG